RGTIIRGLAVVSILTMVPNVSRAADISCVQLYDESLSVSLSEDIARKLWPSGFRPSTSTCNIALLQGRIEKGDFERYKLFYRRHHRGLQTLLLASPGGDAEEAIKIGRLVRKYYVTIWAPMRFADNLPFQLRKPSLTTVEPLCSGPTCICASACG